VVDLKAFLGNSCFSICGFMKENMKFDLHVHSEHSFDSNMPIKDVIKAAAKTLDGIAITDHDSVSGHMEAEKECKKRGLIFIPGMELKSPSGDIVLLGISEIPDIETFQELEDFIKDNNGAMFLAHPFAGPVPGTPFTEMPEILKALHGIEVYNAFTPLEANLKAMKFAKEHNMTPVATTDAHHLDLIGKAFTIADNIASSEDFIENLKKGNVRVGWL